MASNRSSVNEYMAPFPEATRWQAPCPFNTVSGSSEKEDTYQGVISLYEAKRRVRENRGGGKWHFPPSAECIEMPLPMGIAN